MTADVIRMRPARAYRESSRGWDCPRCLVRLDRGPGVSACPACDLPVMADLVRVPVYRTRALTPPEIARAVEIEGHGGDPWTLPPADLAFVVSGRADRAALARAAGNGWSGLWFLLCCIAVALGGGLLGLVLS